MAGPDASSVRPSSSSFQGPVIALQLNSCSWKKKLCLAVEVTNIHPVFYQKHILCLFLLLDHVGLGLFPLFAEVLSSVQALWRYLMHSSSVVPSTGCSLTWWCDQVPLPAGDTAVAPSVSSGRSTQHLLQPGTCVAASSFCSVRTGASHKCIL